MGKSWLWSDDMVDILIDSWGVRRVKVIADNLGLKETQVIRKANNLGLGGAYNNGFLNKMEVCRIMGMKAETISKFDIPFKKRKMIRQMVYAITPEELLEWLEKNQDKFNAIRIKQYALGYEPDWLVEKRKKEDRTGERWTPTEVAMLKEMYRHKISYEQMAIELKRSVNSLKRKIGLERDYTIKHRKIDWTTKEVEMLKKYVAADIRVKEIAKLLNKTPSAIENKKYVLGLRSRSVSKKTRDRAREQISMLNDKSIEWK